MSKIKFFTYVMDGQNKNLSNIQPLIIEANENNTFLEIKNTIQDQIGFPIWKQLLFFNNSVQPDQSRIEQAAPEQSDRSMSGELYLFLYLLSNPEKKELINIINRMGEHIIDSRIKNNNPLSKVITIPKPMQIRKQKEPKPEFIQDDGNNWVCNQCTYQNSAANLNCIICESGR